MLGNFKIGDRVKLTDENKQHRVGDVLTSVGVVVGTDGEFVRVRWPKAREHFWTEREDFLEMVDDGD